VLTDNANRTFSGGGTNLALLNTSQTWTGTPTFPVAFYRSNGIAWRLLYSSPTNINIASAAVAAVGSVTNQGDFVNTTSIATVAVPPLLGTNSYVLASFFIETPAQTTSCGLAVYAGPSTNYVGSVANGISGTAAQRFGGGGSYTPILYGAGSHTNQLQGAALNQQSIYGPTNFCDTSATFTLYFGAFTTTSATNINIRHFKLFELVSD
jgi:hypothetical protein